MVLLLALLIPSGKGEMIVHLPGKDLKVFTYRPVRFRTGGPIIFVFHGMLRNAAEYRNDAIKMGDRFGALIVTPEFDQKRFPNTAYNRGGIVRADGTYAPPKEWTYSLLPGLIESVKIAAGSPDSSVKLIGHSAGGQFLARLVPFLKVPADRIVISNPSSWVFPTTDQKFPYGLGGMPAELRSDEMLRQYFSQPVTIYLGEKDDHQDGSMDESKEAQVQGPHRFARGKAFFATAEALAKSKGWTFRWNLVTAPGIEHDHTGMFNSPNAAKALFESMKE